MSSSDHQPMEGDQATISRKRPNSDRDQENDAQNKRSTISIADEPNTYSASGLKNTLHGNIYQLKLLMLFLKRGLDKGYFFRLATEMDDAEKFDDLVFEYENERKDGKICRFLQAKHKQDESKKISDSDLLTEKGDFSLQKYFTSYRKIKGNPKFKGCEIKDFIICTNIDLEKDLSESFEPVEGEDNILKYNGEESKLLKLIVNKFPNKKELDSRLKDTSELKRLAKRLAEYVSEDKPLNLIDDLFKSYHVVLGEKVVDVKNVKRIKVEGNKGKAEIHAKFHDSFLCVNSSELKRFRSAFRKAYLEMSNEQVNDDEFWHNMKKRTLKISQTFGKFKQLDTNPQLTDPKESAKAIANFKTCEDEQLHVKPPLPDDYISDEEIEDFFEKLVFAVNQPNEKKLVEIIKDELGKEFNNIDKENVYSRFYVEMGDWMKEKEGRFYSHEEGKAFFKKIKEEILGPIWFRVKYPVSLFTGREEELRNLHEAVQAQENSNESEVILQTTSISGLGGIGKSELARKYAKDHCQDYDGNVIWIDAETCGTMEESFRNLARDDRLGIPTKNLEGKEKTTDSIIKDIYDFFAKRKSLFIFDNAEKSDDLNKFLPPRDLPPGANKPYVLITSREIKLDRGIGGVELKELKSDDAKKFVRKGLHVAEKDTSRNQEIEKLVEKLQCFPLALQQAVAHITETNEEHKFWGNGEYTIGSYLEEYEEKKKELLNSKAFESFDNGYAKTTFTTWNVTIDKIKGDKESGQRASEILDVIAYFAPDNIPVEIFYSELEKDDEKPRKAVKLLNQYSMIKLKHGKLHIHRLVQQVIRLKLKEQENEKKTLQEALQLVNKNLKKENLDHAISAWVHLDEEYKELVTEYCEMPKKIAEELCNDGRYEETHFFEEKALPLLKKVLGENHLEVAIMHRYLGNAYGDVGKHEEKKKYLEKALEIFGNHLKGNSEEFFKQALSTSTFKKYFEDQVDDNKKVWIRVLKVEIAKTNRNLGNAYGDLADFKGNKEEKKKLLKKKTVLLKEALESFEKYAQDGNGLQVYIAKTKRNLGNAYGDLADCKGNKEEKKSLLKMKKGFLKGALEIFEKHAQDGNRLEVDIAKTKRNLGNAYGDLADFKGSKEEKKKLFERKRGYLQDALVIFKKYELKIDIAETKRNLGNAYGKLGDHQKRIELLEEALPTLIKHYGPNSFRVTKAQKNLAKAYKNLAKKKKLT